MNSLHTVYINSRQLVASLGAVIHGCWNSVVKVAWTTIVELSRLGELVRGGPVRDVSEHKCP